MIYVHSMIMFMAKGKPPSSVQTTYCRYDMCIPLRPAAGGPRRPTWAASGSDGPGAPWPRRPRNPCRRPTRQAARGCAPAVTLAAQPTPTPRTSLQCMHVSVSPLAPWQPGWPATSPSSPIKHAHRGQTHNTPARAHHHIHLILLAQRLRDRAR